MEVQGGFKWVTRRKWAKVTIEQHLRAFHAGELVYANSNYGACDTFGYLRYTDVWFQRLSDMRDSDIVAEGRPYEGLDAFRNEYMIDIKTKTPLKLDTEVMVIEFEYINFDGTIVPRADPI
jgi:hypothetical protein